MTPAKTAHPILAKAARIALVFMLVFWSSFRVEYALAAQKYAPEGLEGHAEQTLVGLTVYEVDRTDPSVLGNVVCRVNQDKPGNASLTAGEQAMYVAVATWSDGEPATGDDPVKTAGFVEWEVDGNKADAPNGVLTLSPTEAGTMQVVCHLKETDGKYVAAGSPDPFQASFVLNVEAPESDPDDAVLPDVDHIQILDTDGNPIADPLVLEIDDEYQFDVELEVINGVTRETLVDYRQSTSDKGLLELTDQKLENVLWKLSSDVEPDVAEIDKDTGSLKVYGDAEFVVTCFTSPKDEPNQVWPASVHVIVGKGSDDKGKDEPGQKAEDPQGEDHSNQVKTLRVVADLTALQADDEDSEGEGDDSDDPESAEPAEEPDAENDVSDEGREDALSDSTTDAGEEEGGDSDKPEKLESDEAKPVLIDKTYTVDELANGFEQGSGTYTMPTTTGSVDVSGKGVWLSDLLKDAGIDVDEVPIESVEFISFTGASTTVSWADLTSGGSSLSSVLIASESRVLVDPGEESQAGDDGESPDGESPEGEESETEQSESEDPGVELQSEGEDDSQLLPYTRFRVLFNTSNPAIDSSALRWIDTIKVNPVLPRPPAHNDVFSVSISYVPVPSDVSAVLVAVPSHNMNGRWDCLWERSTDGKTWTEVENSAVQTLYIPTGSNLGAQYRVTISSNIKDDESGEFLSATSDPVTITEGSGFSVVLGYNPPLAGSMAIFQSKIYDYRGNVGDVTYKWEWTEDGGASWSVIDGNETGATLELPTEPISEADLAEEVSSSEESTANLVYIRVTASAPDPDNPDSTLLAVSNMQPLTVRVGDTGTDGGMPDLPSDLPGSGDSSTTPGVSGSGGVDPGSSGGAASVTEVSSIILEDSAYGSQTPSRTDLTSDVNVSDTPTQTPVQAPAEIYINDQVSEQIIEQRETVEQAVEQQVLSTQPGARWTSLNTVAPDGDDVRAVLADNPFAPFVLPCALGITASGVVEKLIAFRRQLL